MFTVSDAPLIRHNLGELDFTASLAEPSCSAFADYFKFYQFDASVTGEDTRHTAGIVHGAGFDVVAQYFAPTHLSLDPTLNSSANPSADSLPNSLPNLVSNSPAKKQTRGTIVLLHGYFDHSGIYRHIIKHSLQQGFSVVVFDMPGHGLSSGESASIESFEQYSEVLLSLLETMASAALPKPWHLLGQSTGAAVMIDCLLKDKFPQQLPLSKFVALAPLLRPYAWQTSRLLFSISRRFVSSTKRKFSENSHDQKFLDFLRTEDPLQSRRLSGDWILAMIKYQKEFESAATNSTSLQIIQGTADKTVDWEYNLEKFQQKFPKAQVQQIPNARHHLVNESESYRAQVFAAVDRALSSKS